MNKKKLICTILASTMLFSLLVGCKSSTSSSSTTTPAAVKEDKLDISKTVDLTWYLQGGAAPKDNDLVNAEISKYTKEKINANVKFQLFDYASYSTKIATMIASGENADFVWTSTGGDLPFRSNAVKGSFMELDSLLSKYGKNVTKALGPVFLEAGKVDGKTYAVPVNKDRAHGKGFMFNQLMVDKYKFDITKVKTMEDLEPMLKTIMENEKGNIVTNMNIGTAAGTGPMSLIDFDLLSGNSDIPLALYGNNDPSNTKIFNEFDTPEFKAQIKTVRKFYEAGYVRKDAPTLKNDTSVAEGKAFVSIVQTKPNGDKETSTLKSPKVQQVVTKPVAMGGDLQNSMMALTKNSKNPERAMMLLDLMYSDKKLINMAVFGLEGTHYTKVSAEVMAPTATPFYPSGVAWRFGNQFLNFLNTNEASDKWAQLEKFNNESVPMNSVGFQFDGSAFTTEMAAIVTVSKEYVPVIITGSVDPDVYLPKYLAALKSAGIDKVQAEMQKQYDAFVKTKKK